MSKTTVSELFAKFANEETEIRARVTALSSELETLTTRLDEVEVIRAALEAQSGAKPAAKPAAKKAAPKKAAAKPAAKKVAAKPAAKEVAAKPAAKKVAAKPAAKKVAAKPAAKPAAKKVAAKPAAKKVAAKPAAKAAAKPAAKKAVAAPVAAKPARKGRRKADAGVHSLGIVDAAIHFAKVNNAKEADAGDVLEWFRAAGYKTRTGTPTRNSVYVSLNREASTTRDDPRVTRPRKGRFAFHF
ncbi:MAG: chemotaxis protein histidine kinase CheA [Bradymonadia bacterium]|jgi:chemotaxis protein histidine kinase CheA